MNVKLSRRLSNIVISLGYTTSVVNKKSLYFVCHSGLDPESSVSELDSRFRGNDVLEKQRSVGRTTLEKNSIELRMNSDIE